MGLVTPGHLVLVLAIALLVLGPGKLPETGAALGKAIRSFRDGVEGRDEPQAATVAPAPGPSVPGAVPTARAAVTAASAGLPAAAPAPATSGEGGQAL